MRLRVTVKRHGLPDTPIIWSINTGSNPTIYQLLEQVNEIIPIESSDQWGLEDYAVELKGNNGLNFECLHFQSVAKVMREDDEVIIRPLLSQDLKTRKISGRHQISADGKHLVDGLAFGRPLLRKLTGRPDIHIPPRKRPRLTITDEDTHEKDDDDDEGFAVLKDGEDEQASESGERQLVLHADFDDDDSEDDQDFAPADEDADTDTEDDEDFAPDHVESSDEDLEQKGSTIGSPRTQGQLQLEAAINSVSQFESEDDENPETQGCLQYPEEYEKSILDSESDDAVESGMDLDDADPFEGLPAKYSRAQIIRLNSAFPLAPLTLCRRIVEGANGDVGRAWDALASQFAFSKPKKAMFEGNTEEEESTLSVLKIRRKSRKRSAEEFEDSDSMQVEVNETQDSLLNFYDQNGLPPGSIAAGKALSIMAEVAQNSPNQPRLLPKSEVTAKKRNMSVVSTVDEGFSKGLTSTSFLDQESLDEISDESSDESEEDDTSTSGSSGSSSSDSSDEEDSDEAEVEVSESSSSESDSDSSSGSSSDDDVPEEVSSKYAPLINPNTEHQQQSISHDESQKSNTKPQTGKPKTKYRNQRRSKNNALRRFQRNGTLPAGTTLKEFRQLHLNDETSPEEAVAALQAVRAGCILVGVEETAGQELTETGNFERQRQDLLASIASGGIEVGQSSSRQISGSPAVESYQPAAETLSRENSKDPTSTTKETWNFSTAPEAYLLPSTSKIVSQESEVEVEAVRLSTAPESPAVHPPLKSPNAHFTSLTPATARTAPLRRARLDLGAGKRLLFGALGIKTPKTKQDEEKVRNNLMKDVKPTKTTSVVDEPLTNITNEAGDDSDSWREKIIYRAVECCQDGIELSEPPFPFKQRWDPQQQTTWSEGSKRKKDRDQPQYYEEPRAAKKRRRRKDKHSQADEAISFEQEDFFNAQHEDPAQMTGILNEDVEGEINQQLMNDIQTPAADVSQVPDDLAPLPNNPSSLPPLEYGNAKVGMTIAFKQLIMSADTNWQPQMSPYRTAIVIAIAESGELDLALAMRDRARSGKSYDETGDRIYGKFDMPVDDEEEEDDGRLNVSFAELVEPKIIQNPPDRDVIMGDISQVKDVLSFDEPTTFSHEAEPVEAQFSHVTETPLNSDAPESNSPGLDTLENFQEFRSPRSSPLVELIKM